MQINHQTMQHFILAQCRIQLYVLLLLLPNNVTGCPDKCSCKESLNGTDVKCQGNEANWNQTTAFPNDTISLHIAGIVNDDMLLKHVLMNLPKLKTFILSETKIEMLSDNVFSNLTNLEELQLLHCVSVTKMGQYVFANLSRLHTFRVSGMLKLPFTTMVEAIAKANAPLNTLVVDHQGEIDHGVEQGPTLDRNFYQMFDSSAKLSTVVLTNDHIQTVRIGFSKLYKEVKCMIFKCNLIKVDWTPNMYLAISSLNQLRYFDTSFQGASLPANKIPPIDNICTEPLPLNTEVFDLDQREVNKTIELMSSQCLKTVDMPRNLRYMFVNSISSGLVIHPFTNRCVNPDNRIRYIDASDNPEQFPGLMTQPMIGFLRLQYYNVQRNQIRKISYHSFSHFPRINTLLMGGNRLGNSFRDGNATFSLHKLRNLTSLDLAQNDINTISLDDLTFLLGIENVNLSSNLLYPHHINHSVPLGFNHLNLSDNYLTMLPKRFQENLEKLSTKYDNAKVDLTGNPLVCSCNNLDFLKWFVENQKYFTNFEAYSCTTTNENITQSSVDKLHKTCLKGKGVNINTVLIICTVFGVVAIITVCVFSYRHRNQLNYRVCFSNHLRCKRWSLKREINAPLANQTNFDFDVFIGYEYHDSEFVLKILQPQLTKRGFTLCIAETEFPAGQNAVHYINSAIDRCRCTLLVVSQNYVRSTWCSYEILVSLALKKKVLVLSLDEVKARDMPAGLIHLSRNTRQIYPRGDEERLHVRFWENLARALRTELGGRYKTLTRM